MPRPLTEGELIEIEGRLRALAERIAERNPEHRGVPVVTMTREAALWLARDLEVLLDQVRERPRALVAGRAGE